MRLSSPFNIQTMYSGRTLRTVLITFEMIFVRCFSEVFFELGVVRCILYISGLSPRIKKLSHFQNQPANDQALR
jgi:hypothetical protein